MLGAVIFDFDGVITDSEILHLRAFNQVLAQHNITITKRDYYRDYLGLTDLDLLELLAGKNLQGINAAEITNLAEQKKEVFEKLIKTEGVLIDGVRDFLLMLRGNDVPMAICSGALLPEIELILEDAKLQHFFEVIVSAEHVKKGKPDPEGFLLALAKLNEKRQAAIPTQGCIVIEDSHWGLEAANTARMHTVAITNSYDADQLSFAEKVIDHLSQLSINDLQKLCN